MIILAHLSNITLFSTVNKKSYKTFTDGKKYARRQSTPLMKPFTRVQKSCHQDVKYLKKIAIGEKSLASDNHKKKNNTDTKQKYKKKNGFDNVIS